jgi:hypothetical protein
MKLQNLMLIVGLLAAVTLSACGGGNSCGSACNATAACAAKFLGQPVDPALVTECTNSCSASTCTGNKQAAIDCITGLACGTDSTVYEAAVAACATAQGCGSVE